MYTTSTPTPASQRRFAMARISAAGRVQAARERAEVAHQKIWDIARETGQLCLPEQDYCYICNRATDHTGEHTQEQIDAYRATRDS